MTGDLGVAMVNSLMDHFQPKPRKPGYWLEIDCQGVKIEEVCVQAKYGRGAPATLIDPAEPAGWDISRVDWKGVDILPALTPEILEHLTRQLEEY